MFYRHPLRTFCRRIGVIQMFNYIQQSEIKSTSCRTAYVTQAAVLFVWLKSRMRSSASSRQKYAEKIEDFQYNGTPLAVSFFCIVWCVCVTSLVLVILCKFHLSLFSHLSNTYLTTAWKPFRKLYFFAASISLGFPRWQSWQSKT